MGTEKIEELKKQIKKYVDGLAPEDTYAFISYSHEDAEIVYEKVLDKLKEGYRFYIDLEFENHESNEDWVDTMAEKITDENCKGLVCFVSDNYRRSYASFLELLTSHGNEACQWRKGKPLGIERIDLKVGLNNESWSAKYTKYQECMIPDFLSHNTNENEMLKKGLETWYNNKSNYLAPQGFKSHEDIYNFISKSFKRKESSFFTSISMLMEHWFISNGLTGNNKSDFSDYVLDNKWGIKSTTPVTEKTAEVKNQSVNPDDMKSAPVSQPVTVVETPITPVSPKTPTPAAEKTAEVRTEPAVRNTVVNVNNAAVYKLGEKAGKYCAVIEVIGDSFRLLKGSKISANHADSTSSSNKSIRMEKSIPYGNYRLVTEDIDGSSSAIASVVKGASESGPKFMSTTLDIAPNDIGRYLEPCNGVSETSYEETELPQNNFSADHYDAVTGRGSTSTGDITYSLYGVTYTHNQSAMMLNVFEKVMERHSDLVASLINAGGMTCLSDVDYTLPANRFDMKPYFRTSRYYSIGGGVCVGTSYSFDSKLILIAKLLAYCGEPKEILVSDSVKLPNVSVRPLMKSSDQFFFV